MFERRPFTQDPAEIKTGAAVHVRERPFPDPEWPGRRPPGLLNASPSEVVLESSSDAMSEIGRRLLASAQSDQVFQRSSLYRGELHRSKR